ncbi:hypothetical protein [Pseudogracilibacillus sp. ICA-222130]|uniref:hypothetical protein n=1 Tax=Pseudogracilibacillus sp. ICA-222130 TaxID=3134655 RepID=UPI0030C1C4CF
MKKNVEKTVSVLMWIVVALAVLTFFAAIMFGHAKGYDFIFGFADPTVFTKTVFQNVSAIG